MTQVNWRHITVLAIVAIVALAGYRERIRLAAWLWHVRHGGVESFGNYIIPIPLGWYIQDFGTHDRIVIKIDQDSSSRLARQRVPATITLLHLRELSDLSGWTSLTLSSFKQRGADPTMTRTIMLDDEAMSCVGGNIFSKSEDAIRTSTSWDCRSTGQLEILLTAPESEIDQAWEIISRIRKKH